MRSSRGLFVFAVALALQGCAHSSTEVRLDEKLSRETEVKSRSDLGREASERISDTAGLSGSQRANLQAMRDSTQKKLDALAKESLRLRSVLIKDLIATADNRDEISLIKTRLRENEDKRLTAIFDAVDQVDHILGRDERRRLELIDDFFRIPY